MLKEMLTAKNRHQLRNPTLGIRVWATFTFFIFLTPMVIFKHLFWGGASNKRQKSFHD